MDASDSDASDDDTVEMLRPGPAPRCGTKRLRSGANVDDEAASTAKVQKCVESRSPLRAQLAATVTIDDLPPEMFVEVVRVLWDMAQWDPDAAVALCVIRSVCGHWRDMLLTHGLAPSERREEYRQLSVSLVRFQLRNVYLIPDSHSRIGSNFFNAKGVLESVYIGRLRVDDLSAVGSLRLLSNDHLAEDDALAGATVATILYDMGIHGIVLTPGPAGIDAPLAQHPAYRWGRFLHHLATARAFLPVNAADWKWLESEIGTPYAGVAAWALIHAMDLKTADGRHMRPPWPRRAPASTYLGGHPQFYAALAQCLVLSPSSDIPLHRLIEDAPHVFLESIGFPWPNRLECPSSGLRALPRAVVRAGLSTATAAQVVTRIAAILELYGRRHGRTMERITEQQPGLYQFVYRKGNNLYEFTHNIYDWINVILDVCADGQAALVRFYATTWPPPDPHSYTVARALLARVENNIGTPRDWMLLDRFLRPAYPNPFLRRENIDRLFDTYSRHPVYHPSMTTDTLLQQHAAEVPKWRFFMWQFMDRAAPYGPDALRQVDFSLIQNNVLQVLEQLRYEALAGRGLAIQ